MYSIQTIIFVLFISLLGNINIVSSRTVSSSPDVFGINTSEGQDVEQYVQAMIDFWTDERLKAAKPKSLIQIDSLPSDTSFDDRKKSDDTTIRPNIIKDNATTLLETLTRDGYPVAVGKVFFYDDSLPYACSASVVTSNNKDMIFTAGHCVYSTQNFKYVQNLVFVPQYDNGVRPHGTWPARCLYAMSSWVSNLDLRFDVAIVLLHTLQGQHIQDVVGSQQVGFNHGHLGVIYSFGYPINYDDGQVMTYCTATKYSADVPDYDGDKMSCVMNQGFSGGPWFESYSTGALSGIQTSVNSFTYRATPGVMYGPHFDAAVQSMYETANNGNETCPSNTSPSIFSTKVVLCLIVLQFFSKIIYCITF